MLKCENRLIIFTRYPTPGKAKKRLIPVLGPEKAAQLQRKMSEETLRKAKKLKNIFPVSITVFHEGGSRLEMEKWLGNIAIEKQKGIDLGDKMIDAFDKAFNSKAENVVIIGSDCPDISGDIIRKAFTLLEDNDLVLGPAEDGGYYLIGLCSKENSLFCDVNWGSEHVLKQTEKKAEESGLSVAYLEELKDIDRPQDIDFDL